MSSPRGTRYLSLLFQILKGRFHSITLFVVVLSHATLKHYLSIALFGLVWFGFYGVLVVWFGFYGVWLCFWFFSCAFSQCTSGPCHLTALPTTRL